jgi:hypothetical protein
MGGWGCVLVATADWHGRAMPVEVYQLHTRGYEDCRGFDAHAPVV